MDSYQLGEYETQVIDCPPPTPADKRLAQDLASGGDLKPRIDIDWIDGGQVKVRTHSWVGVVRFSAWEIRVVPKLLGGTLRVLHMIEYSGGVPLLARLTTDRPLPADGEDLFELIAMLLAEETRALLRNGLIRDYHPVNDSLDVLRGRMRVREQFLRRYGQPHRIECSFDEFDGDVPENQLLAAALQAAAPRVTDDTVRSSSRMLAGMLDTVCEVRHRRADWYARNINYGRRNAHYKPAHTLAKLVLDGLALNDHRDKTTVNVTSFMVDMNAVFERFVTRLVINALTGTPLRARAQTSIRAVILDEETDDMYSAIRPDLIIEDARTGRTVPIDVKYKLYDAANKISSADIYQAFVYAYSLSVHSDNPRAGLIYAATAPITGPALRIKPLTGAKPARVRGAGLDVAATLDEIGTPAEEAMYERMRTTIRDLTGLSEMTTIETAATCCAGQVTKRWKK
ncbi:MAG: McrC family protein [Actinomycetia bacterium]|nr:McrC family protein [Actinomycetes bacterium]